MSEFIVGLAVTTRETAKVFPLKINTPFIKGKFAEKSVIQEFFHKLYRTSNPNLQKQPAI